MRISAVAAATRSCNCRRRESVGSEPGTRTVYRCYTELPPTATG
ncbi:hypothetical protein NW851_12215 [Synechococcus sp. H55.7]